MTNGDRPANSITKRELIAKDALAAILSNPSNNHTALMGVNGSGDYDNHVGYIAREMAVREALGYTHELLKQLGEPK